MLSGRVTALGSLWQWAGDDSWHVAPDTGNHWPKCFFDSVPYRPGNPYGDVRVAWEPARLQHLVALARLSSLDPPESATAKSAIANQLASWVRANPTFSGIHYISAMECALRIIAVCHTADLLRSDDGVEKAVANPAAWIVASHASLVHRRMSRHSSANNHAIAEAAGLVYAGHLFPELPSSPDWLKTGLTVLEREADRQILADGSGAEQTVWYLRFVADLYVLVARLLEGGGQNTSESIARAGDRAMGFLHSLADERGSLPTIGDSDDGHALSPYVNPIRNRSSADTDHRNRPLAIFPCGGYSLARSASNNVVLLFDHGPLGLPPTYVHGHADALSICVRAYESAVLIDPGTYTYNGDPQWRAYFRSTGSHNTILVDGLDQARQETSFMWSEPYQCELLHHEVSEDGATWLVASHDGYRRRCGVHHIRGVVLLRNGSLVVMDRIVGTGHHALTLHWHTPAEGRVTENVFLGKTGDLVLRLTLEGGTTEVVRGRENPPLGWRSPTYGLRIPSTTLSSRYTGPVPHEFVTTLTFPESQRQDQSIPEVIAGLRARIHATSPN